MLVDCQLTFLDSIKAVEIQLTNQTGKPAMTKVFGQTMVGHEFGIDNTKCTSSCNTTHDRIQRPLEKKRNDIKIQQPRTHVPRHHDTIVEGSESTIRNNLLTNEPELQHSRGAGHCMLWARGRRGVEDVVDEATGAEVGLLNTVGFMP